MDFTQFSYFDRRSGELKQDPICAPGLIAWFYNSAPGWLSTNLLFSRRWVSCFYGWLHKQRWSRRKIKSFATRLEVNLNELTRSLDTFESFNAFVIREIDLSKRPINPDPEVCVAPADGRVLVYPVVDADRTLNIKRATFNLGALLRDEQLTNAFSGGSLFVSRLYLNDYHHFHFPDHGSTRAAVSITGKYFTVSPFSQRWPGRFYVENYRMITLFHSDHFGRIAIIEVGAFTMGSIQQRYQPGARVGKGDHKGFFELGGSIVILLFERGAIRFDDDLCKNSLAGTETYVRLGESIGRVARG